MKKLTQFSVNYPITVLMLVLAILLLGYISFQELGIDLLPDLNTPRLYVEVKAGERPPEEIEMQYTQQIEAVISRLNKVAEVSSVTKVGNAKITVEYAWNTDMDEAFLDLQKALTAFTQNSNIDELNISQQDPNAQAIIILGFSKSGPTDLDELRRLAENYIQNELIRLEGIASVELIGGEEKEVIIETDSYNLEAFGISSDVIANKISSNNRNLSGGSIVEMGRKYIIKGISEYQSLDDIRNTILAYKTSDTATDPLQTNSQATQRIPLYLKDVARVKFQNKEPENIVHVNQQRCMGLAIYKETKYNTVQAAKQVLDNLDRLRKSLPDYELTLIKNQATFINTAIREVQQTALIGIFLAVLILFVFLRRIGVTAVLSTAIPISIIATFNLMYFNGLSLNIMTLGGLALGAGMLVDNAIVVMENIFRHLEQGKSLREAAIEGTAQVGGAITAATITTIVVFLPIVYIHGAAGELFRDQAWTVAFSLVSSLFVAILVIPVLSVRWLKKSQKIAPATGSAIQFSGYRTLLEKILNHKAIVLSVVALLAVFSFLSLPYIGSEFLPQADQGEFTIEIKLPEGTDLFRTEGTVTNIEHIISTTIGPSINTIYSKIGPSNLLMDQANVSFEGENSASIRVILQKDRAFSSKQLIQQLNTKLTQIPELDVKFLPEQTALQVTLGIEKSPLVVEIKGKDLEQLQELTTLVADRLRKLPVLSNLATSFDEGRPEVLVVIDRTLAGLRNLSLDNLSTQLKDALSGRQTTQWDHEGELKDITLKFPKISLGQLNELTLTTSDNQKVRLDQIAQISTSLAPKQISRRNQNRTGEITAYPQGDLPFDQLVQTIDRELKSINWPAEYGYQITGEELKRKEAFGNLKFALILAIILVYMVLAAQFESLIHPLIIISTVPLASIGTILLFLVINLPFNIMSYIGLIMLAGIAVNDSIILVDAINQQRRSGSVLREAILQAAQMRIRPIIMTSLTTILALLPLTIGIGEGAALRAPMALAVIGGLVSSTLLTLIIIPVIYYLIDSLRSAA